MLFRSCLILVLLDHALGMNRLDRAMGLAGYERLMVSISLIFISIANKNYDCSDGSCAGFIRKQMVLMMEGADSDQVAIPRDFEGQRATCFVKTRVTAK